MRVISNKKVRAVLALVIVQSMIVQGAWAGNEDFQGKVLEVLDGATIKVSAPEGERVVRLAGLETANLDAPLGKQARDKLAGVLLGKTVTVRGLSQAGGQGLASRQTATASGVDAAGRTVHYDRSQPYNGQVLLNGQDIAMILLGAGLAWLIYNILHDNSLQNQQSEAMRNKTGVWSSGTAVSAEGRPVHAASPQGSDAGESMSSSHEGKEAKDISEGKKSNPGLHLGWDKKKGKKGLADRD